MQSGDALEQRYLLPRILPSAINIPIFQAEQVDEHFGLDTHNLLFEASAKWEIEKNLPNAIELISISNLAEERDIALEAAKFVKKHDVSPIVKDMANNIIDREDSISNNQELHLWEYKPIHPYLKRIRTSINYDPTNALEWCDAAFYYRMIKEKEKSIKSAIVAISLAPDSRNVLRKMSSLLDLQEEGERALYHLLKSPRTLEDPWLLSTEISLANKLETKQHLMNKARQIINSQNFSDRYLTELLGSMATSELSHGSRKNAKRLFIASLTDPTENSLAQAEWATNSSNINLNIDPSEIEMAFEANARDAYFNQRWKESFKQTKKWAHFQPLNVEPWIFASYLASGVLDQATEAKKIAKLGLSLHKSSILLNNYMFAAALDSDFDAVDDGLKMINWRKIDTDSRPVIMATIGLCKMLTGRIDEGFNDYGKSILEFKESDKFERAGLAQYNLALVLRKLGLPWEDHAKHAKDIIQKYFLRPEKDIYLEKLK